MPVTDLQYPLTGIFVTKNIFLKLKQYIPTNETI